MSSNSWESKPGQARLNWSRRWYFRTLLAKWKNAPTAQSSTWWFCPDFDWRFELPQVRWSWGDHKLTGDQRLAQWHGGGGLHASYVWCGSEHERQCPLGGTRERGKISGYWHCSPPLTILTCKYWGFYLSEHLSLACRDWTWLPVNHFIPAGWGCLVLSGFCWRKITR